MYKTNKAKKGGGNRKRNGKGKEEKKCKDKGEENISLVYLICSKRKSLDKWEM